MARKFSIPRHFADIGPRPEFRFSDADWARIAAEMPGTEDVKQYRQPIEEAAAWLIYRRQNPELGPGYRSPVRDKKVSEKIETAARNLSLAMAELSGFARMHLEGMFGAGRAGEIFVDRTERLTAFKADVDRIASCAPRFLKGIGSSGPKLKGTADPVRIVAWANASACWEEATGKEATANPKSDHYASREPDGPIVRFLQAFSAAIPGECEPTGFQVSTFIKTYWAGERKKCWQTGKW